MQSFTDLQAWKKGMELVEEVYRVTKRFPKEEQYSLVSQLRRAAVSILANLAEGFSRASSPDKAHKYTIARGECAEAHALLLVGVRLGYLTMEQAQPAVSLALETGRLLTGLVQTFSPIPSLVPSLQSS